MAYQYEVVVIGSGSAGNEACLGAAKAGLSTLLVEEGSLGGTAMHRGAYAVRALRACATYFSQIESAAKAGASVGTVKPDWTSWMTAQRRSTSDLSVEFGRAIDREKVDLRFGHARLAGPNEIAITDAAGGPEQRITAKHIIIATGSRPNFEGQPEVGILNSDQLLRQALAARHLFVIGGGYIGCELASIYGALGSRVTLAEAGPRLLPNWDPIAGERFLKVLLADGIEVLLNEPVALPPLVAGNAASYRLSTGTIIQPDVSLIATGRKPNSDHLGLESVGLTAGTWIPVNEQMQTSIQSIYAVGDITGIGLLDSIAAAQARVAVDSIRGKPASFNKRWFPQFLHTEPPIVSIGWTEDEAKAVGLPVEAVSWSGSLLTDDDFSAVQRDQMTLKCLLHADNASILGCIAIGSRAAEVINIVSTAMQNGQSAREVAKLAAVHPSATEVLVRTLRQRFDHP
jgi:dihydrolipoamide dehydrogenase